MVKLQISYDLRQALEQLHETPPQAYAFIEGGSDCRSIWGVALMYLCWGGTLFLAEIQGLPQNPDPCAHDIFGFHIHEGDSCRQTGAEPFAQTGPHWNPTQCPHPAHAGDLPPLFASCGYALTLFYTRSFVPEETVGHTLIIHAMPDDFSPQASKTSGEKIACGEILSNDDSSYFPIPGNTGAR